MPPADTIEKAVHERERRGVGTATVERLRMAGQDIETPVEGPQRVADWPLRQLYKRKLLQRPNEGPEEAERRYATGERLYGLFFHSQMFPLGSRDYRAPYSGAGDHLGAIYPANEWREHQRAQYRKAVAALGPNTSGLVVLRVVVNEQDADMVGRIVLGRNDKKTARAAVAELLMEGLDNLSRFWS